MNRNIKKLAAEVIALRKELAEVQEQLAEAKKQTACHGACHGCHSCRTCHGLYHSWFYSTPSVSYSSPLTTSATNVISSYTIGSS